MPVPFIERLLLNRPNDVSVPQTMAQIAGIVVVTRAMAREGSLRSPSKMISPSCMSANGRMAPTVFEAPDVEDDAAQPMAATVRQPINRSRMIGRKRVMDAPR